ncbi:SNF2 family N-terminal domain protein [Cryptosporidium felis]|nr:SNF2 family N-terminal domain protein [Cryptosporidium felis]
MTLEDHQDPQIRPDPVQGESPNQIPSQIGVMAQDASASLGRCSDQGGGAGNAELGGRGPTEDSADGQAQNKKPRIDAADSAEQPPPVADAASQAANQASTDGGVPQEPPPPEPPKKRGRGRPRINREALAAAAAAAAAASANNPTPGGLHSNVAQREPSTRRKGTSLGTLIAAEVSSRRPYADDEDDEDDELEEEADLRGEGENSDDNDEELPQRFVLTPIVEKFLKRRPQMRHSKDKPGEGPEHERAREAPTGAAEEKDSPQAGRRRAPLHTNTTQRRIPRGKIPYEYLVKYHHQSYSHCKWISEDDIDNDPDPKRTFRSFSTSTGKLSASWTARTLRRSLSPSGGPQHGRGLGLLLRDLPPHGLHHRPDEAVPAHLLPAPGVLERRPADIHQLLSVQLPVWGVGAAFETDPGGSGQAEERGVPQGVAGRPDGHHRDRHPARDLQGLAGPPQEADHVLRQVEAPLLRGQHLGARGGHYGQQQDSPVPPLRQGPGVHNHGAQRPGGDCVRPLQAHDLRDLHLHQTHVFLDEQPVRDEADSSAGPRLRHSQRRRQRPPGLRRLRRRQPRPLRHQEEVQEQVLHQDLRPDHVFEPPPADQRHLHLRAPPGAPPAHPARQGGVRTEAALRRRTPAAPDSPALPEAPGRLRPGPARQGQGGRRSPGRDQGGLRRDPQQGRHRRHPEAPPDDHGQQPERGQRPQHGHEQPRGNPAKGEPGLDGGGGSVLKSFIKHAQEQWGGPGPGAAAAAAVAAATEPEAPGEALLQPKADPGDPVGGPGLGVPMGNFDYKIPMEELAEHGQRGGLHDQGRRAGGGGGRPDAGVRGQAGPEGELRGHATGVHLGAARGGRPLRQHGQGDQRHRLGFAEETGSEGGPAVQQRPLREAGPRGPGGAGGSGMAGGARGLRLPAGGEGGSGPL